MKIHTITRILIERRVRKLGEIVLLVIAYLFGCINGAYYIGRFRSNQDIREHGSSNAGARNAGRVFGRSAFVYTVVIDALKTVLPLLVAIHFLDVPTLLAGMTAIAVLLGHLWPVQLKFRGGKGVVVYLATALVLATLTLLAVGITVLIGRMIKRNFSLIGLIALATIPVTLLILKAFLLAGIFLIMLIIVLLAHREGK
ncbi:glycerol-3-phosphate acyltransferase [Lentibacillus sediminis]|uniref:glycerol-3-phosphate acyltransferase n=1 Tax=Lentibacillus sediminis TaxID=1940529 RepID=UPI001EFE3FBF|nr:glycerol-3-phosphate acyltransferase [Lentibacillus sediminis]